MATSTRSPSQAQLAGRRLPLRKRAAPSIQPGTHWQAFLKNAGLDNGPLAVQVNKRGKWLGEPRVRAHIVLSLEFHEKPNLTRTLRTPLRAGYG